jgi:ribosome biogenesis GTPase
MGYELPALGWSAFFEEQWQRWAAPHLLPARIAAEHRGAYEVWSAAGAGAARLGGRARHDLGDSELPGVGDWVALDAVPRPGHTVTVQRVLDRRTVFIRGAAGRAARAQVIAANVDLAFVVCGLDEDFNPRRIDRYVALVRAGGVLPVVVLSKADLAADSQQRAADVRAATGVDVEVVSALHGEGLATVRRRVGDGTTAALVGSSGAGKSTLANALLGCDRMPTGPVRVRDGRGRHVTTHRQLLPLPGGGLLLDTPGMRELQLVDETGLAAAFDQMSALAQQCRFADCGHGGEPGCAVQAAVAAGELAPERLEHFLQLQREARAYERRRDERVRRMHERAWGKLSREARRRMRTKRGEE